MDWEDEDDFAVSAPAPAPTPNVDPFADEDVDDDIADDWDVDVRSPTPPSAR